VKIKYLFLLMLLSGLLPLAFFPYLKLHLMLNLLFFISMLLAYIWIVARRSFRDLKFLASIDRLLGFLKSHKDLFKYDISQLDEEFSKSAVVGLWLEFKRGLLKDPKGEYHQLDDAGKFFNADSMLHERINTKFLAYMPQFFVGLGITGTFLGLAVGLGTLGGGNVFTQTQEAIAETMSHLIGGVTTSFYTSLYGLYYSIIFSLYINYYLGEYEKRVNQLRDGLNFLFNENLTDKSIEVIRENLRELNENNKQFHKNLELSLTENLSNIREINLQTFSKISQNIETMTGQITQDHSQLVRENQTRNENMTTFIQEKFTEIVETSKRHSQDTTESVQRTETMIVTEQQRLAEELKNSYKSLVQTLTENLEKMQSSNQAAITTIQEQETEHIQQMNILTESFFSQEEKRQTDLSQSLIQIAAEQAETNKQESQFFLKNMGTFQNELLQSLQNRIDLMGNKVYENHAELMNDTRLLNEEMSGFLTKNLGSLTNTLANNIELIQNTMDSRLESLHSISQQTFENIQEKNALLTTQIENGQDNFIQKNLLAIEKMNTQIVGSIESTMELIADENSKLVNENRQDYENLTNTIELQISQLSNMMNTNYNLLTNTSIDLNQALTDSIDKKLALTSQSIAESAQEFITELKLLNHTFKSTLSNDLRDIFNNEFVQHLDRLKQQIIDISRENAAALADNRNWLQDINEESGAIAAIYEDISEKLKEAYQSVYSEDFIQRFDLLRQQLTDTFETNNRNMKSYNQLGQTANQQLELTVSTLDELFKRLDLSLRTLLSDDFMEAIERSKSAYNDYTERIENINSVMKDYDVIHTDNLMGNLEAMNRLNQNIVKISDSYQIINQKLESNLKMIYSEEHLRDIKKIYGELHELYKKSGQSAEIFSKTLESVNGEMSSNSQKFLKLSSAIEKNLEVLKDEQIINSIEEFRSALVKINEKNNGVIGKNLHRIDNLTQTWEYIDLNLEKVLGNVLNLVESLETKLIEIRSIPEQMSKAEERLTRYIQTLKILEAKGKA
jgi:hypothetical protein